MSAPWMFPAVWVFQRKSTTGSLVLFELSSQVVVLTSKHEIQDHFPVPLLVPLKYTTDNSQVVRELWQSSQL